VANFVFNIAKGRVGHYATLPATNDALILIPLETSGLESDATLIDKDDFAAVVSGATNEQTTAGRKTLASVTSAQDDTNDRWNADAANVTYSGVAASSAISKWVVCYDPDTTAGTDADLIPLTAHDLSWTPDGNDFTITITDFFRAS
jgi:hypothetical protein